jgi:hypothetical protein
MSRANTAFSSTGFSACACGVRQRACPRRRAQRREPLALRAFLARKIPLKCHSDPRDRSCGHAAEESAFEFLFWPGAAPCAFQGAGFITTTCSGRRLPALSAAEGRDEGWRALVRMLPGTSVVQPTAGGLAVSALSRPTTQPESDRPSHRRTTLRRPRLRTRSGTRRWRRSSCRQPAPS